MADHQDAIISEKLKLLNISFLKNEGNQPLVGVLNTDVSFSGSAVGVLAELVFSGRWRFRFTLPALLSLAVIGNLDCWKRERKSQMFR